MKGSCLENKEWLLSKFYDEMHCNGHISEDTFDKYLVPKDRDDMNGFTVERRFGVNQENHQHAKILSSTQQINERRNALYNKQMIRFERLQQLYDNETKDFVMSKRCENKLIDIWSRHHSCCNVTTHSTDTVAPSHANMIATFKDACNGLTLPIIMANKSSILLPEVKSFIRVRSDVVVIRGKRTIRNIPSLKDDALARMCQLLNCEVHARYYKLPVRPVAPEVEATVLDEDLAMSDGGDGVNGVYDSNNDG